MRLSRSQVAFAFALLLASFIGGDAIAQRYGSYYTQQQIYRQNQAQQIQMQRQQEQMRRQQEQARQQQATMRRQQLEQQRIMQQRRDQAIRQRQIAVEHQRKVTEQRQQAQSKKIEQGTILSNQKATHQNLLKHRSLEKHRQERLLRLKQEFFQTQQAEKKKADKGNAVRLFSLTETFNAASSGRNISAYQPGKVHASKELTAQRQAAQISAKKIQSPPANSVNVPKKEKRATTALNQASKDFQRCDLSGKCTCSFHGDTQVLTKDGFKSIKLLVVGQDYVWSRSEYTGDMDWKPITAHYSNVYDETVEVRIRDSESGETQIILSNRIHPFYINAPGAAGKAGTNEAGRWVEAQSLKSGDLLLTASAATAKIIDIRTKKFLLNAYNITVDDYHTYFVQGTEGPGNIAIWVHNNCRDDTRDKELISLKSPSTRHYADKVSQTSIAKNKNTVINRRVVDIGSDVFAIKSGRAQKIGDDYRINGRTYKSHNGTLYPASGPGLYTLSRSEYKALGVLNKLGDTPQAKAILNNMGIPEKSRSEALKVWRAVKDD
ncbi:TPA: hypothetical protein RY214_002254 [Pseudomonas aeruginosa]|uniref:polymorphic toxin-type HINT domain-containing protein n=1 Tax=Pseudomonas aeruginosa TaxID=287 RepID=UPI00106C1B05|nr:hypothetical protein [Pseudomonas aeruginosa]